MAVITKLLEGTLTAGQTSISFTDSDIPNSFIFLGCSNADVFPLQQSVSGTTLTLTYQAQSSALSIIIQLVKDDLSVIDNVESESDTDALSANQGRILKGLIDNITPLTELSQLEDVSITSPEPGDILTYDSISETWDNLPMPSIPSSIDGLSDVNISTPADGQVLTYDNGEWINSDNTVISTVDYSTSEHAIGTWINNKTLYEKTVDLGNMPNNASKSVLHGISQLTAVISMIGACYAVQNSIFYARPLPMSDPTNSNNIRVDIGGSSITVKTGSDWSAYSGYLTIRYTKD